VESTAQHGGNSQDAVARWAFAAGGDALFVVLLFAVGAATRCDTSVVGGGVALVSRCDFDEARDALDP
jgi:hypothetical protein